MCVCMCACGMYVRVVSVLLLYNRVLIQGYMYECVLC